MRPRLFPKDANRALAVEGLAIRPVGNEDVVGVSHREDARLERNLLAPESAGITAAVDALVVCDHDVGFAAEARYPHEDLVAEVWVALDDGPLVGVEGARLVEDRIRDSDLAHIVEKAGACERAQPVGGQLHGAPNLDRELGDTGVV